MMLRMELIFLPLVLLYQGWTYYVFRKRLRTTDLSEHGSAEQPESAEAAD